MLASLAQMDPTYQSIRSALAVEGGATRKALRGPGFEGSLHGVVRPAGLDLTPLEIRLSDAVALMTTQNVLGGWAALNVQGNGWFDGTDRKGEDRDILIHCLAGSQLRVRSGIRPSEGLLFPDEIVSLENYEVATLARATYDEMRLAKGLREAVVVLDMATSTTSGVAHTTTDAVHRLLMSHHKTRGIAQARRALPLASSRSASPWESRTRLMAELDAGVSGLRVNAPVFDPSDNLLGVADLIDPRTGLVLESDGATHRELDRHTEDNVREEKFERAGLVVCRVTSLDHKNKWETVGRIQAALRDAQRTTEHRWTLEPPPWWQSWRPARRWA